MIMALLANMVAVDHIGKFVFFVSYTIFNCNTSNMTDFGLVGACNR